MQDKKSTQKPNILMILVDQLAWRALSVYGGDGNTPAIDSLYDRGVAIDACYCPCPLCQPSRAAFWSGVHSHRTDVLSNGRQWPITPIPETMPTLGETFVSAGYRTMHFGKRHDGGALRGFWCAPEKELPVEQRHPAWPYNMDTFADRYTVQEATRFLGEYGWDQPLLMVADLVNPHNICGWIGENKGPHTDIRVPDKPGMPGVEDLPDLPDNFEFNDIDNRPIPVQYICCSHVRQSQTVGWTAENYRHYLAAYYHYLKCADDDIAAILQSLDESGHRDDTLIVFFADHGDNMTSRGAVTKQVSLYEEVTRVPLIFSGAGVVPRRGPVQGLASLIDLFPTLCSVASIPIPSGLDGVDISSVLREGTLPTRKYVSSEWTTEWGYTVSPGRMLRSGRYKYMVYLEGNGEELYDLERDPGEKRNLVKDASCASVLERMRNLMAEYLSETGDTFYSQSWKADPRWRSHELGWRHHVGVAAPQYKGV
ncbi:MAG: sulfatase-like hydrolase/transferase [Sphaerochaetaceae bacterium]|nr:sulfatase-like hydrolase/transferase [Sphaerochaetaceae bacterium]